MRTVVAIIGAAVLSAACQGAEPPRCTVRKGLYEQRLALVAAPQAPAADGDDPGGVGGSLAARSTLDREYAAFFQGLSEAVESNNPTAVSSCCKEAADDRIGALACHLLAYVVGGRSDRPAFLSTVPSARKDAAPLWDLNAIALAVTSSGSAVPKVFQPKGPSYRYIDELFLLLLDGHEEAIVKYFSLASLASGDFSRYMDEKLGVLLRDAPATMVTNWYLIRKYKAKIRAVIQTFLASATAAEAQQVTRAVQSLCKNDDPDCQEILRMFKR